MTSSMDWTAQVVCNPPPLDAIPPEPSYLERLRDDYAGRAMVPLIAMCEKYRNSDEFIRQVDAIPGAAYDLADAMLAERGKR